MNDQIIERKPLTVGEYNLTVMHVTDIKTGKQYRRERRKKLKKTYLKFGSEKIIAYL